MLYTLVFIIIVSNSQAVVMHGKETFQDPDACEMRGIGLKAEIERQFNVFKVGYKCHPTK